MKIPLQHPATAVDYSSMIPGELKGAQPSSSGLDMDNLAPEQADAIPDTGKATVHYKVHRRSSEQRIGNNGDKTEHHRLSMHVTHFEPHKDEGATEPEPKPKKKLSRSTDAQEAVRDNFA